MRGKGNFVTTSTMLGAEKHQRGIECFRDGQVDDALHLLGEAIAEGETSERWSDWAVVQLTAHNVVDAEKAFRRALKLDPDNNEAAANWGGLLAALGKAEEAVELLERCLPKLNEENKVIVARLLIECRSKLRTCAQSS